MSLPQAELPSRPRRGTPSARVERSLSFLNKSLKARNSAAAALMVLVAITIVSTVAVLMMRGVARHDAIALAQSTAQAASSEVAEKLEVAAATARNNAVTVRSLRQQGVVSRDVHNAILAQSLDAAPTLIGVAAVWEPNALDGQDAQFVNAPAHDETGQFVPYWYRANGQIDVEVLVDYNTPGAGDYYQLTRNSGAEHVLEPYIYPIAGVDTLITTMAAPITVDGRVIGGTMADIALDSLQTALSQIRPMDAGRVSLISTGGVLVAGRDSSTLGQPAGQLGFSGQALNTI